MQLLDAGFLHRCFKTNADHAWSSRTGTVEATRHLQCAVLLETYALNRVTERKRQIEVLMPMRTARHHLIVSRIQRLILSSLNTRKV